MPEWKTVEDKDTGAISTGIEPGTANAATDEGGASGGSDLPERIPARDALAASFDSYDAVKAASRDDLMEVDGIGETTADKILAFIEKNP